MLLGVNWRTSNVLKDQVLEVCSLTIINLQVLKVKTVNLVKVFWVTSQNFEYFCEIVCDFWVHTPKYSEFFF